MKKYVKQILCMFMAFVMVTSFTGCGNKDTDSEDVEIVYEYEYVSGSNTSDNTDSTSNQESSSGTNSNKNPSSDADSGSNKKPSSDANSNKNPSSNTATNDDKYSHLRGKTVRYATWKDPYLNEDGVAVKSFEEKYGIKVKIDLISQTDYIMILQGMIASGNSPDVYFANGDFPGCLSCIQPLDAMKLDLTDPIWDTEFIELSKVNGKAYLVNTIGNIWNEVDCVYYNKKLLEDNNITTPSEYYAAGKWDFAAMTKVMSDVKALGPEYIGGYLDWECIIGSAGAGYYKWQDGKFVNGIDDNLIRMNEYLAQCVKDGLVHGLFSYNYRDEFINGKCGIAVTNAFGLKKTGYWRDMNTDIIGYTYLPDYDAKTPSVTSGYFKGWGLIKGAKEPEAAGVFLRHYLDVNNYDTSTAFISSEAESFFFKLTSVTGKNKSYMSFMQGTDPILGNRWNLGQIPVQNSPDQISTVIKARNNVIDSDVKTINRYIQQQTAEYN